LEVLKEIPTNILPSWRADAFAVTGRRSNAEYVSCVRKSQRVRNPKPWAQITIYSKPTQVIPGLCRLQTARFNMSERKWTEVLDRADPGYAVATAQRDCSAIDVTKITLVVNHVEDFALLRLLQYATDSGPLRQAPTVVGLEWRVNRIYYRLMYPQSGCTRVFRVGGTAIGGFEVEGESTLC
jgi:hypothetical protein